MFAEVIATLILLVGFYVASTIWQNRHLPPGPFPLPILGNLLSISQNQPYRDFANMAKKYGKLFRIQVGTKKAIVINSHKIAREALVTKARDFAGRPPHFLGSFFGRKGAGLIFSTFSQRWKIQRKMVVASLRLSENKANIDVHIEELCKKIRFCNGKPFSPRDPIFTSVGGCLSSMILGEEFKLNDRDLGTLVKALHVFVPSLAAAPSLIETFPIFKFIPFEVIKSVRRAGEDRDEIFERKFPDLVSTFQGNNVRSFSDAMVKYVRENDSSLLTEEHLLSSASDVFFPGTETPASMIIWIVLFVTKYPDVQARLHRQLDDVIGNTNRLPSMSDKPNLPYLVAFIVEMHRIVSETPMAVPHFTTRDTSLAGFFIPRDMTVFVNLWAIHHDPDYFEDPLCFRPERFLDQQGRPRVEGVMPFSAGIRSCPGESLGKKLVFLFTARLLYNFRFECPMGEELPGVEDSVNGVVLDCKPFKVCAIPRKNRSAGGPLP